MGVVSGTVDAVLVIFSTVLLNAIPLIDAQTIFGQCYPPALVGLKQWFIEEYGVYLLVEKPPFYVGIAWMEILFLWPLSVANVYGIAARRPWAATTSLIAGVYFATVLAVIMSELLGSGRGSNKLLLQVYMPFMGFAVLAILKGLVFRPRRSTTAASNSASTRKKRA